MNGLWHEFDLASPLVWSITLTMAFLLMLTSPRRLASLRSFLVMVLLQTSLVGLIRYGYQPTASPPDRQIVAGPVLVFFPDAQISAGENGLTPLEDPSMAMKTELAPPVPLEFPEQTSSVPRAVENGNAVVLDEVTLSRGVEAAPIDLGPPPKAAESSPASLEAMTTAPVSSPALLGPPILNPDSVNIGGGSVFFPTITLDDGCKIFVIDRSGSMATGGRLTRVLAEVLKILNALPEGSEFQVFFYDDKIAWLGDAQAPRLLKVSRESLDLARHELAKITPGGGTDPVPALKAALALDCDVVYFLSDGDFSLSEAEENDLVATNKQGAKVHGTLVGETTSPPIRNSMERIATRHLGQFLYKKD